ncbi:YCF48-related protein [Pseudomonas sp. MYb185]|uniref:WD40/YVTN/BNR-like repeat-containing protein n=1 Tax=Pseudomonas sp. MYb185 TaxID=1848729 RepID=UPI000CFE2519|nr:YCF48-related protein [Pseudomonas sp. MYb185]PRB77449.1 glycosyl hydrolase [Pseudomonas sp. MYb185]
MNNIFQHLHQRIRQLPAGVLTLLLLMPVSLHTLAEFRDPLDWPADAITRLMERPTQAVARAGETLVAVGAGGLIATSADGSQWTQSHSPVQSDLLAVDFPTPQQGWVVGHDGVVLHSGDAGVTWEKQLDGRLAKALFNEYYANLKIEPELLEAAQSAISLNYAAGPTLPLLDVWFADALHGFAVGSFGTLIATTDAGKTWQPWLHRIDNEDLLNLNAVHGVDDGVYIAAERGVIFKLEPDTQRFEKIETGYDGSFFGLLSVGDSIIAYGLSGTAYRSDDQGRSWVTLHSSSNVSLTAGASLAEKDAFVLVNARGDLLFGNTATDALQLERGKGFARYTGVVSLDEERLLMTSLEGIRSEAVHASARR